MTFQILFQDKDFIIVLKPAGVLTVPPRMADQRPILGKELEIQLKTQIFPVHRLDFEVRGIVLFALNSKAHQAANSWFENKKVQKVYQAKTEGPSLDHLPAKDRKHEIFQPQPLESFQWESHLLKGKKRTYQHPSGKASLTMATYLKSDDQGLHYWQLEPVTGRSHQLRYELSAHGFPIVGDSLYGSKIVQGDRIELLAHQLIFLNDQLPNIEIESLF